MLFKETVSRDTLELLKRFMEDNEFKEFALVGGTALSLLLGHRISIDIDLFSENPFSQDQLADYLRINYRFEPDFIANNTLKGEIHGIKLDILSHQYKWIDSFFISENIRLAGLKDLAAMKLNAVSGNGTRLKDFIDIAFLSTKMSFTKMLESYQIKYQSNPVIPLKAIMYFDDILFDEPVKMTGNKPFVWKLIEQRLMQMQQNPDKIFEAIPC